MISTHNRNKRSVEALGRFWSNIDWSVLNSLSTIEDQLNYFSDMTMFISKLFEIDFETNVSDKSFIEGQRFEAIMASLSSSNNKYI